MYKVYRLNWNKLYWILNTEYWSKYLHTLSFSVPFYLIKSGEKKTEHFQKLAIHKKSTVFVLSIWNLVKMISSLDNYFHQVSWGLGGKCGFFTIGHFLNVGPFFNPDFMRKNESVRTTWLFKLCRITFPRKVCRE